MFSLNIKRQPLFFKICAKTADKNHKITKEQHTTGQGTVLCLNGMVEKTQKNGFQSCGRGS